MSDLRCSRIVPARVPRTEPRFEQDYRLLGSAHLHTKLSLVQRVWKKWIARNAMAATIADTGIVKTQAQTIFFTSPQRTALSRWILPTPAIDPAMTWVVDTGSRKNVANKIEIAADVSAQNPPLGFRRVSRPPIVWTIRQPPLKVPRAMAACADRITQTGTWNVRCKPDATKTPVIMPIVFCASFVPCAKL